MSTTTTNRRDWLRNAALATGSMAILPGFMNHLQARASVNTSTHMRSKPLDDYAAFETTPPALKARLMFNENPFGPSEKAQKAAADAIKGSYEYPFADLMLLAKNIADHEQLTPEHVSISNGSSPYLLAGALLFGKGTIISGLPTYEDLLTHAENFGTKVIRVPLTPDYTFDLDAMEKAITPDTSLIYICNPNNPTGTILDTGKLRDFCKRVSPKTTVFIDEAYIDLVPDPEATTLMGLVRDGHNIIIARTFSKLYGLAGMRVGYVVGQPETVKKLTNYSTGAFGLSSTGVAAALASYQDKDFMKYAYDKIQESKAYLYGALKKEGYDYVPTSANFLVFPTRLKGEDFVSAMMKLGVGVRSWYFDKKDWCRVSIGTLEDMKNFGKALAIVS